MMALSFAERMAAMKQNQNQAVVATVNSPLPDIVEAAPVVAPARKVFGKPSTQAVVPSVVLPEVVEEPVKVVEKPIEIEVGNIILLANEANKIIPKDKTEGEALVEGDMPIDAIKIKQKIAEMETFDGISLRHEMDQLKKLIKASPDACMFLLPEELGLCVRALRRMTDNKVAMDMGTTKARASKKQVEIKLTAEDIAAALDDL